MSPKKRTIPKGNESSSKHQFSGDMLVFGGVGIISAESMMVQGMQHVTREKSTFSTKNSLPTTFSGGVCWVQELSKMSFFKQEKLISMMIYIGGG